MSQFMKYETRPAPDAVLLFRAQEYALQVILYVSESWDVTRAHAVDMQQHDKLIHLSVRIIILVMILMVLPAFWGWFGNGFIWRLGGSVCFKTSFEASPACLK